MVRYPSRAAKAIAFLKRPYNDIDIFVEDTGNPNMWIAFLRNFLPESVRLNSVSMLGGRERVIDACKADQERNGRPRLYIIDGDFDFLLGRRKPNLMHLYRLRAYCIENVIATPSSILEVAAGSDPQASRADILRKLKLSSWIEGVEKVLCPLFACYAVARKLLPSQMTIKLGCTSLFSNTPDGVDFSKEKAMSRVRTISRNVVKSVGFKNWHSEMTSIRNNLRGLTAERVISGKDYLLPAIHIRLRKLFSYKGTIDQLKVALAQMGNAISDSYLKLRLRRVCETHGIYA